MRLAILAVCALFALLLVPAPAAAVHWQPLHWETTGTRQLYIVDATCDPGMREPILYAARAWNDWQRYVRVDIVDPGGCVQPWQACPYDGIHIWVCPNQSSGVHANIAHDGARHIQAAFISYEVEWRTWLNDTWWKNAMAHELGHAIGLLGHDNDPASVMYPISSGGHGQIITRHDLDVLTTAYCHGGYQCSPGTR